MTKKGKTIALLLALGGVCSLTSAAFKVLLEKDAQRVYQETLKQAVSDVSHARLVCQLSTSNQELERLKEAMESDDPVATYQMLNVFPLNACSEDVAKKELVVFKLREFKNQYIEKIKEEL